MSDRFGLVADRYQLRDKLGSGGMGRVWLARDEMLDRDVAIKEVSPPMNLGPDEAAQLRILVDREARAAARINHPNVVKIFDVLRTADWPWLVMEYIPSASLQRAVQQGGPMPPADVARIGLAVLDALNAAHDSGVLHRDVKPDNVLLADDGRVMLSDFGLASLDADGKATRSGTLGTPQYVAPERARYGVSSREADLWSLGATLYAAVEGRSPYQRDSVLETLSALAVDPPDPMRLAGPLEPVISGLLQREPSERTHPDHLADQLRAVMAGAPVTAPLRPLPAAPPLTARKTPPAPLLAGSRVVPPPHRKRWTVALAGAGALVTAVAVALVVTAAINHTGQPAITSSKAQSPLACENAPTKSGSIPVGPPGKDALPDGWTWFTDPGGLSVGVPKEWSYWRVGGTICFRDAYGGRTMSIMQNRLAADTLPGYQLISITEQMARGPGTEWEFRFAGLERQRHGIAWVTPGPTLLWITDDSDFVLSRSWYDLAKVSFDPHGGPGGGEKKEPPPPERTDPPPPR